MVQNIWEQWQLVFLGFSYDAAHWQLNRSPTQLDSKMNDFMLLSIYFLNILRHAGIARWPSKDLKLLSSMGGEVKFGRFCCLLMLQSFDNAWRVWM